MQNFLIRPPISDVEFVSDSLPNLSRALESWGFDWNLASVILVQVMFLILNWRSASVMFMLPIIEFSPASVMLVPVMLLMRY